MNSSPPKCTKNLKFLVKHLRVLARICYMQIKTSLQSTFRLCTLVGKCAKIEQQLKTFSDSELSYSLFG